MKSHKNWSYPHYVPPFFDGGDIYICRVAPSTDSITLEWKGGNGECSVYFRVRNEGNFKEVCKSFDGLCKIEGLKDGCEYEFYVSDKTHKSRIRLARCGECFGTPVNYLHPEDEVYSFSGQYLCSPSIVRHPDGYLLASMDVYKDKSPQNLTLVFRSDDNGATWHHLCDLFPSFWGRLFVYQNEVYMLSCSTEYGDLLIGKSPNGGKTFNEPTVLLRGSGGKNGETGVHKNPQPVVEFDGRVWNTLEWGSWGRGYHAVMVMSAPIGSDLLDSDNWAFSEPVRYNPEWLPELTGQTYGNIEGCLVDYENKLYNIMRFQMGNLNKTYGYALVYEVDTQNPEAPIIFRYAMDFPANASKFVIKYHEKTGLYYTIANRITDEKMFMMRNLQSLMCSKDLKTWNVVEDLIDRREVDHEKEGFQYADFIIENDTILYLTRTATAGAASFHDSNYSVFNTVNIGENKH